MFGGGRYLILVLAGGRDRFSLGLALVKGSIETHDEKVEVHWRGDGPREGASTVRLPLPRDLESFKNVT